MSIFKMGCMVWILAPFVLTIFVMMYVLIIVSQVF